LHLQIEDVGVVEDGAMDAEDSVLRPVVDQVAQPAVE